jgi:SAM-dependent methyltransferase
VLAHPLAYDLDLDDARAPAVHRAIIEDKAVLRAVYDEWYTAILGAIGTRRPVLEIGSGAGFLATRLPGLFTSDVRPTPAAQVACSAAALPVRPRSLGAIVMTNTLHHLPDVGGFLDDAARVVRPGGRIAMVEPWVSTWSRWVYGSLHHEPFDPDAPGWSFAHAGPLSSANGALPWMLVSRDRIRFAREHPTWEIAEVRPGWSLCYLVSGGVSLRTLVPSFAFRACRAIERRLDRDPARWAMFALIVLERREDART